MNADELKVVQGLLEYLEENFTTGDIKPDIQLIDSNGETAGRIEYCDHEYRLIKVI